jgi:hypothetical protein
MVVVRSGEFSFAGEVEHEKTFYPLNTGLMSATVFTFLDRGASFLPRFLRQGGVVDLVSILAPPKLKFPALSR